MSVSGASIVCIYCKATKPRPRKGEHLILEGLGGRATTRTVCGVCNNQLGQLDQEFLRNTHIALHRFLDSSVQDGEVRAPQFAPFEHAGRSGLRALSTRDHRALPPYQAKTSARFRFGVEREKRFEPAPRGRMDSEWRAPTPDPGVTFGRVALRATRTLDARPSKHPDVRSENAGPFQGRRLSGRRDSNSRRPPWQGKNVAFLAVSFRSSPPLPLK